MKDKFTKQDLIQRVARESDITMIRASELVNNTLNIIRDSLANGNPVVLSGLGTFWVKEQKARNGIHPVTREKTLFPASLKAKFKPGKKLAETINNFQPMSEKRKLKRRNFIHDMPIWDRSLPVDQENETHILGDLADITVEGVMIVSDQPIEENKEYQLRVILPEKIHGKEFIDFDARSIRCNKTIHESIFTTGFIITKLDKTNHVIIETLIEEYAV